MAGRGRLHEKLNRPDENSMAKISNLKSSKDKQKYWSHKVTKESDALDLEKGVFLKGSPRRIALSLISSAEKSRRRKSEPFRSAMSMLSFYINRAGKNLSTDRRNRLEKAKGEFRKFYMKSEAGKN
jgi:hypothetical protein